MMRNGPSRRQIVVGVTLLVLFLVGACNNPVTIVDEGHVGLVTEFGSAKEVRPPGITMINPFVQDIREVETRVRPVDFKDIDAASAEAQSVKLTGKLNYALEAPRIVELYREVGLDFQGRILGAALNSTCKAVLPKYPVNDILPNRAKIEQEIVDTLNVRLKDYGITVTALFIENLAFSKEFQDAIEQKQAAAQTALKEAEVTKQSIEKARQAVEAAKGDGDATLERAKRQAEANRELANSITPEIIRYRELEKWNGVYPPGGTVITDLRPSQPATTVAVAGR